MTQLFNLNGGNEITSLDGAYGFYLVTVDGEGAPLQSGFVTLATLKTFINTDPSVVPSSNPWRGCLAQLGSNQSIPNGAGSFTPIQWTSAVDTDSIWSAGAPTRLTVPTGVTRVRIRASVRFAGNSSGLRYLTVLKNGAGVAGGFTTQIPPASTASTVTNAGSASIPVTAGDYFEIGVAQTSGGSLNVDSSSISAWAELEILEAS